MNNLNVTYRRIILHLLGIVKKKIFFKKERKIIKIFIFDRRITETKKKANAGFLFYFYILLPKLYQ